MNNPIITFIIPTVGRDTLERTVNSLINQTNPNWKCIIVFDGVESKEFDDNRIISLSSIKLGHFTNIHGTSGLVRNEGIKLVDTEWIGFVDDDDTIHPDYVGTLYDKYLSYDLVIWRMKFNNGIIVPRFDDESIYCGNVGISFSYRNKGDFTFETNWDGEDFSFVENLIKNEFNYIITPEVFYNVNH
jgi:glycosyltransferase involved in cell wall biosynthesis